MLFSYGSVTAYKVESLSCFRHSWSELMRLNIQQLFTNCYRTLQWTKVCVLSLNTAATPLSFNIFMSVALEQKRQQQQQQQQQQDSPQLIRLFCKFTLHCRRLAAEMEWKPMIKNTLLISNLALWPLHVAYLQFDEWTASALISSVSPFLTKHVTMWEKEWITAHAKKKTKKPVTCYDTVMEQHNPCMERHPATVNN